MSTGISRLSGVYRSLNCGGRLARNAAICAARHILDRFVFEFHLLGRQADSRVGDRETRGLVRAVGATHGPIPANRAGVMRVI